MKKYQHQGAGGYDRRAIMRKAHREYHASMRRRDGLSFGYWLAYAWRIARDRRKMNDTAATMRRIADMIEDHASRRITLAPEIVAGMKSQMIAQRGAIL